MCANEFTIYLYTEGGIDEREVSATITFDTDIVDSTCNYIPSIGGIAMVSGTEYTWDQGMLFSIPSEIDIAKRVMRVRTSANIQLFFVHSRHTFS